MKKILVIQTAFIGDVVLATSVVEKLKDLFPKGEIDFLLRQGNEGLLNNNPHIRRVLIWNKRKNKHLNLLKMAQTVRKNRFDLVVNLHRFASSGFISWWSGAGKKVGFDKNPLSFAYDLKVEHRLDQEIHENERNLSLIDFLGGNRNYRPRLYFSEEDQKKALEYVSGDYVVIAPASVWFTKQFPIEKWQELVKNIPEKYSICLLGAGNDVKMCEDLIHRSGRSNMKNLAGKLTFLESAALMKSAAMSYVNDSAPMHFASAVNAPTTAIFCSTLPEFGFGPLSDESTIWQIEEELPCRPCGLHGLKKCPKGHFKCAYHIAIPDQVLTS